MEIFPTPQVVHRQPISGWLSRLTLADGLLGLILLAAAILRLANLGYLPLSDTEALQALEVWRFWQPEAVTLSAGSPAYFSLTSWLTQLFGFGDGVMRLIPALFGLGLIGLPWLLRHRLGTQGALVTAVLLAISPLNTIASRTVGGDSIALFALLLMLIAFIRYQETAAVRWLYTLFAALGLGLSSSALFYSGLVTLLLAWFVHSRLGLSLFVEGWHVKPTETNWRKGTAVGVVVFLLLSTFFLLLPNGLGGSARLAGEWFQQFGGARTLDPLLAFVRYEPALVILVVFGLIWAIVRSEPLALFAVYWFSGSLILLLLQRAFMSNALLLTLPTALLAGILVNAAWRRRWDWFSGIAGGVSLAGSFVIFVNLARLGRVAQVNPPESTIYLMVILLAILFVGLVLYFAASEDATAVPQGVLLAILGFFIFYQWGTGWWLAQEGANDPRERWVSSGTDFAMRELDTTVRDLSRQLANSDTQLQIGTRLDVPALNWYLKEYPRLEQLNALPLTPTQQVIITDANPELPLAVSYSGSDFAIRRLEPIPLTEPSATILYDTFRWWFFHQSTAVTPVERAVVWVRADLLTGQP